MKTMGMDLILDVVIAACGLYLAANAIMTKKNMTLKNGMMVSKNIDLSRAKDIPGFINFMFPITLVVGIAVFICGIIGLISDMYHWMTEIQLGMTIVFFIIIVLYGFITTRAQNKYLLP